MNLQKMISVTVLAWIYGEGHPIIVRALLLQPRGVKQLVCHTVSKLP